VGCFLVERKKPAEEGIFEQCQFSTDMQVDTPYQGGSITSSYEPVNDPEYEPYEGVEGYNIRERHESKQSDPYEHISMHSQSQAVYESLETKTVTSSTETDDSIVIETSTDQKNWDESERIKPPPRTRHMLFKTSKGNHYDSVPDEEPSNDQNSSEDSVSPVAPPKRYKRRTTSSSFEKPTIFVGIEVDVESEEDEDDDETMEDSHAVIPPVTSQRPRGRLVRGQGLSFEEENPKDEETENMEEDVGENRIVLQESQLSESHSNQAQDIDGYTELDVPKKELKCEEEKTPEDAEGYTEVLMDESQSSQESTKETTEKYEPIYAEVRKYSSGIDKEEGSKGDTSQHYETVDLIVEKTEDKSIYENVSLNNETEQSNVLQDPDDFSSHGYSKVAEDLITEDQSKMDVSLSNETKQSDVPHDQDDSSSCGYSKVEDVITEDQSKTDESLSDETEKSDIPHDQDDSSSHGYSKVAEDVIDKKSIIKSSTDVDDQGYSNISEEVSVDKVSENYCDIVVMESKDETNAEYDQVDKEEDYQSLDIEPETAQVSEAELSIEIDVPLIPQLSEDTEACQLTSVPEIEIKENTEMEEQTYEPIDTMETGSNDDSNIVISLNESEEVASDNFVVIEPVVIIKESSEPNQIQDTKLDSYLNKELLQTPKGENSPFLSKTRSTTSIASIAAEEEEEAQFLETHLEDMAEEAENLITADSVADIVKVLDKRARHPSEKYSKKNQSSSSMVSEEEEEASIYENQVESIFNEANSVLESQVATIVAGISLSQKANTLNMELDRCLVESLETIEQEVEEVEKVMDMTEEMERWKPTGIERRKNEELPTPYLVRRKKPTCEVAEFVEHEKRLEQLSENIDRILAPLASNELLDDLTEDVVGRCPDICSPLMIPIPPPRKRRGILTAVY